MVKQRKGKFQVVIYPDWCKGCGICAAFCPEKVIEVDGQGKARAVREKDCIDCGFCELHCPDFAIEVRPAGGKGHKFPASSRPSGSVPDTAEENPCSSESDNPQGA